ncbi:hypothetical protein LT493_02250 [Streptomyces tricolor]|nr:hypothetical protein [Streptomyces tricolor]
MAESLAHAGLEPDDPRLRWAVLPRLGKKAMEEAYIPPLVQVTPAELLDLRHPPPATWAPATSTPRSPSWPARSGSRRASSR